MVLNRRFYSILLIIIPLMLAFVPVVRAQFYNGSQITFGQNRVQHQDFNWQYMRADQYDVYYYPTSKNLAQYVYAHVPEWITEVEKELNYTTQRKLQFIVYNTQSDFRESNFAYDDQDFYNQGGVTTVYGTKIYLYFDGNRMHFDRMIRAGVMNVYAHWVAEGASVGSNITADYLMSVPGWYYSGLSSYFGEHWNSDVDAHVKDGIQTGRYADIDDLSPLDATYAGHSFWKFVADTYGEAVIAKILYSTRSSKTIEKGFYYATGVPFRQLLVNWYKYYFVMYHQDAQREQVDGDGVLKHPKKNRDYNNICLAPGGERYAYVTNDAGQVRVWLAETLSDNRTRTRCIWKRYQKVEDNPDFSYPLLAWNPQGMVLGLTLEDRGHCYYLPYDVENRKWGKKFLVDVEKITSWCYSDDSQMMLFSGFRNGQSDLFLYSFLSRSYQNLTNDFYDDYGPVFMKNQQHILFSSNRPTDSIRLKDDLQEAMPQSTYDLFVYSYDTDDPALMRVTRTPYANEYDVQRVDDQTMLFLSDKQGIVNRYEARFDSTISRIDTAVHYAYFAKTHVLTDRECSIFEHSYDPTSNVVADISLKNKIKRINFTSLDLSARPDFSPSVFHNKILQNRIKADSVQLKSDSVQNSSAPQSHGFFLVYDREDVVDEDADEATERAHKEGMEIPVGSGYRVQYTINKVVTQADFSFLNTSYQQFEGGTSPIYLNSGFNALFMLGIHDIFEDYRITGGLRLSVDLNSKEFMFSYENLSKRLDRQILLYRQSITSSYGGLTYTQAANSLFYILKFPFNKTISLRLSLSGRYETNVVRALSEYTLQRPDEHHLWAGAKIEYIFDSSKEMYTNLWRGTKLKIFAEYNQRAEKDTRNLLVVGLDARHSFKLYKNMTLAFRLAASTNVGSARLVYYMGGVDNWINAKFNSDIWVDQSKNYAYQTLATNMRGFKQNIRNGTSFALFSGELRVPFVQLIAGHKVAYEFLNSLQLNLFGDVGTAWTGVTPYSEENCLYTRYIYSGPITVMVKRQVDPFVGGFGVGLRCSLLSYFLRFDYAWGVEDFRIANKKGMFLFSIGKDF